jgi:hypothetical protein
LSPYFFSLEAPGRGLVLGDGVDGAAAVLHAHGLARQVGLGLDGRIGAHHHDLMVLHVGRGERDVLLALLGDGQAVPQRVHALAVQLGLLGVPVDGLELDLHAQALGGLARQVDVEADQLVLVVAKAHGRKVVVQADDDLGGQGRRRRRGLGAAGVGLAAGGQQGGGGGQGKHEAAGRGQGRSHDGDGGNRQGSAPRCVRRRATISGKP